MKEDYWEVWWNLFDVKIQLKKAPFDGLLLTKLYIQWWQSHKLFQPFNGLTLTSSLTTTDSKISLDLHAVMDCVLCRLFEHSKSDRVVNQS